MIPKKQMAILCDLHDALEDIYNQLATWCQVNGPPNVNVVSINASLALGGVMAALDFLQMADVLSRSEHGSTKTETGAGRKESAVDQKESDDGDSRASTR